MLRNAILDSLVGILSYFIKAEINSCKDVRAHSLSRS